LSARVWCWEKDLDLAQKCLIASGKRALRDLKGIADTVGWDLDGLDSPANLVLDEPSAAKGKKPRMG
jgi:hypothetical protein